ncbi:hypothetical protein ONS95_008325 [Cadophora gregata]|uniref:uncharacterized protein n=1 Tax=Cadophora gregata TaxID=51156 RepID=UPI0026DD3316|nr:uncharacterized protein ONS95_008325 [Cadophora gregata]KAK0100371.1 hypothetical protein ONS96_007651 [Cadophora gregata f. sp. sojae]KAK0126745.1 hypothetical protein ONS95_008325 [Cadophora gregata]
MAFADGKYTLQTYYRFKQEDEDEAAKHGLETIWGKTARLNWEEAEMWILAERLVEEEEAENARLLRRSGAGGLEVGEGGSGLKSRESGESEESVNNEVSNVGIMVERWVI